MDGFQHEASWADKAFAFIADLQQHLMTHADVVRTKEQGAQWILEQVASSYKARALTLWLTHGPGEWTLAAATGIDIKSHQRLFGSQGSQQHLEVVRKTGQPLIVADLSSHSSLPFRAWSQLSGVRSIASFPLFGIQNHVMGVLTVMWEEAPVEDQAFFTRWTNVGRTLSLGWQWADLWQGTTQGEVVSRAVIRMTGVATVHLYQGKVVCYNHQFAELFGLTPDAGEVDLSRVIQAMRPRFSSPGDFLKTVRHITDNREMWVDEILELKGVPAHYLRWLSRPVYGAGAYQGRVAVFMDVTAQVMAERHHESFLSLAAHEFRTPVTIIQGVSELMQALPGAEAPEVAESARIIWRESMRLGRTIREIWGAAEAERDVSAEGKEPLDFAAMARAEVEIAQRMWPERTWIYHGPETLRAQLNYEMLVTVLQALLGNAGRFSPAGEAIEVDVTVAHDTVTLSVMDRGPGVDEAVKQDIFMRIPDPLRRPASGGMGLGLYLTGMFVAKMGGNVAYVPRPGGGSVFSVTLPLDISAKTL
ncbi:hypothetical protein BXT84_15480 [Sulfobacillus thermotolerans]|uniref:histidine kinase n=1 Tax=Sulfobacillus thermotolerans TaxID=338644 RepID=A0ABM6RV44_9FIRM|nr:hypothetical protein BXT84_15480 [Sulfobacillus thermotolerans]